jgi:hypothetical protein
VITAALLILVAGTVAPATALFENREIKLEAAIEEAGDLWIKTDDLPRIQGFELKPQGACRGELCVPVKQSGEGALVAARGRDRWFNLSGFARKLGEVVVRDAESRVWSFGEIPVLRAGFLQGGVAPDFALPDRAGKTVRLSDFRGKKVLLLTWASW